MYPPKGTFNGINYYFLKGKPVIRKAGGGYNRERIKNDPAFQKTREINTEFADNSRFVKEFKLALQPFLEPLQDGTLHQRLMGFFLTSRVLDTQTPHGSRHPATALMTAMGRRNLTQFSFTPGCDVSSLLRSTVRFDEATLTTRISDLQPANLCFPKGGTHFLIRFGVLGFDPKTRYFDFHPSAEIYGDRDMKSGPIEVTSEVVSKDTHLYMGLVEVRFYEVIKDEWYPLNAKKAGSVGLF